MNNALLITGFAVFAGVVAVIVAPLDIGTGQCYNIATKNDLQRR
jgi:hypothetical protein